MIFFREDGSINFFLLALVYQPVYGTCWDMTTDSLTTIVAFSAAISFLFISAIILVAIVTGVMGGLSLGMGEVVQLI